MVPRGQKNILQCCQGRQETALESIPAERRPQKYLQGHEIHQRQYGSTNSADQGLARGSTIHIPRKMQCLQKHTFPTTAECNQTRMGRLPRKPPQMDMAVTYAQGDRGSLLE